ncbi:MAG: hypothetical protein AAF598_13040 [Bacteroidota bacterium]
MTRILIFLFFGVLLFSCGQTAKTDTPIPPSEVASAEALPADFKAFYKQFHEDSLFQMAHISFPLEGVPNYIDSSYTGNYFWKKEDWRMHRPFDPTFGGYDRSFSYNEYMVEETISDQYDFGTLRRFYKMDEEWMLIYYAGMNKFRR